MLVPFLIPGGTLEASLKALEWLDLKGYSVTIPHKEAIVPLLAQKDGAVEKHGRRAIRSSSKDGKKIGYNTDYRAAMDSLEDAMGGAAEGDDRSPLLDKQVLMLGAGGVARAIAFGLSRRVRRSPSRTGTTSAPTDLAEEVGCRTVNWGQRASTLADVIINCTPVGMHPHVDDTPVPAGRVSARKHVRVRHGVPSREHHVPQARPPARGEDGHRR